MRRGRAVISGLLGGATLALGASFALASGLVAPKGAPGNALQPWLDVLVVQAGEDELLVETCGYCVAEGQSSLAWIFPVPAPPAPENAFVPEGALFSAVRILGKAGAKPEAEGFLPTTCELKVVDGKGPAGVIALQAWLDTNGFAPLREKDLQFYKGAGLGYAAVKITPKEGKLPSKNRLGYGLRFASTRPFVPLKLLANAGPCALSITLLTDKPIDPTRAEKCGLKPEADRAATLDAASLPKAITDLLETKPGAGLLEALKKGKIQLTVLKGKLNDGDKAHTVESWFEDPPLPWKK